MMLTGRGSRIGDALSGMGWTTPNRRYEHRLRNTFLALVAMGSIYVDFCLCAPWDIRTNRSKKWKGLILGSDKLWYEEECRGPPDFDCWEQCFRLWECMCIMSEVLLPQGSEHTTRWSRHIGSSTQVQGSTVSGTNKKIGSVMMRSRTSKGCSSDSTTWRSLNTMGLASELR